MITVEVNSKKIHLALDENTSLKKLIPLIKNEYGLKQEQRMHIQLNGHIISHQIPTASLIRPLTRNDSIKIELDKGLYCEVFKNLEYLTTIVIKKIENYTRPAKTNPTTELSNIITGIGALIKTSYFLRNVHIQDSVNSTIKNLQIHLLSVMKAIETAHKVGDDFMLEDLLEFELKDNLTKWKILLIPTLKSQILKNI